MKPLIIALLFCVPTLVFGQDTDVPALAEQEILRRGDLVEQTGPRITSDSAAIAEALSPPADDSHKWFITVITSRDCRFCATLERDWQTSEFLLPFANPHDHKSSWSHFSKYRGDDATQQWRWAGIKIQGYPTILIQPPRNGQYGDPKTVVWQKLGYDGDPKKLAAGLRSAIGAYAVRQQRTQRRESGITTRGGFEQAAPPDKPVVGEVSRPAHPEGTGQRSPPFTPPSNDPGPLYPLPFDFPLTPTVPSFAPDNAQPDIFTLLATLISRLTLGSGTTNLLLMILAGFAGLRTFRKPKPPAADGSLIDFVRNLFDQRNPPTNPTAK